MTTDRSTTPLVGVVMGSKSDWETMRHASELLAELGIPHESKVVSAHRTPDRLFRYGREAEERGLEGIVSKRIGRRRCGDRTHWIKVKSQSWRGVNKDRQRLFDEFRRGARARARAIIEREIGHGREADRS